MLNISKYNIKWVLIVWIECVLSNGTRQTNTTAVVEGHNNMQKDWEYMIGNAYDFKGYFQICHHKEFN